MIGKYSLDGDLPGDLVHAILVNLPDLKQVFRLKTVSKQWNSVISSPFFRKEYTQHTDHALPWTLLVKESSSDPSICGENSIDNFLSYWFPNEDPLFSWCDYTFSSSWCQRHVPSYTVVSSSDGLLLCRLSGVYGRYAICNPMSRQWFLLPPHDKLLHLGRTNKEAFVTSKMEAGPGLITFKVICMVPSSRSDAGSMEVYDSMTDEWSESQLLNLPQKLLYLGRKPVCLNGIVHWEFRQRVLIAYNPTNNQCRTLAVQAGSREKHSSLLGVCNGKLLHFEIDYDNNVMQLWVLEDYDKGRLWELKHKVTRNETSTNFNQFWPIALHPFDSNIIYLAVLENFREGWKRFRAYDLGNRKVFDFQMTLPFDGFSNEVFPFVAPSWPPTIWVAEKAQCRLMAMEDMHNNSGRETCARLPGDMNI